MKNTEKKITSALLSLVALFVFACAAYAVSTAKSSDLNKLLSESLDIYNQCEKINGPRRATAEDISDKLGYVSKSIGLLKQSPFDEKKIKRYTDSIAQLKKDIDRLETFIDMAKITDPDERTKLAQKYENDWQRLLAKESQAKIKKERGAAVKGLRDRCVKAKMLKNRLTSPPADSQQLKREKRALDFYVGELKAFQGHLEIGTITDLNERAVMLAKLEEEKIKLKAENKRITRLYDDRIAKLTSGLKVNNASLNDAMKEYFLDGGKGYEGIDEITTRAIFCKAKIGCSWKDSGGNKLCTAQLLLRNKPIIPEDARMLDGLYYVSAGGDSHNYIWVWAGNFHVYFDVKKKEWLEKKKVEEIVKNFIDLSRLTKLF